MASSTRSQCSDSDLPAGDLEMMAVTWHASDEVPRPEDGGSADSDDDVERFVKRPYIPRQYMVRAFGVTRTGSSVCLLLTGFLPYFYVRVDPLWGPLAGPRLREWLRKVKGRGWEVVSTQLLKMKDFVGFRNGESTEFVRVKFSQQFAMRQLSKRLIEGAFESQPISLRCIGIPHEGPFDVYESNIDPILRLLHHRSIPPAGWLTVPAGKWSVNELGTESVCQLDLECRWTELSALDVERDEIAPLVIFSLDIECGSSHGDFPQAKKGPNKLAMELSQAFLHSGIRKKDPDDQVRSITASLQKAFGLDHPAEHTLPGISPVFLKHMTPSLAGLDKLSNLARAIMGALRSEKTAIDCVTDLLNLYLHCETPCVVSPVWGAATPEPPGVLHGDPVIQIGVTMHVYGDSTCCQRHILTLGSCEAIVGAHVHEFKDERDLLIGFTELVQRSDPDILIGYNQFGFDFAYMNGRAEELGVTSFGVLGRLRDQACVFKKQTLSSSALGDNEFRYFDITGRCQIDIMKVVQREHKLDSYRLDAVAEHFIGMRKNDISPNDIFRLQLGSSSDRRVIAEYCVQDCALCNHLLMRLEIIANNIAMANVCHVPLSFIFLRGQGIKVQSLVARRCLTEGFVIPTLKIGEVDYEGGEQGYEGAIVLEPKTGMYLTEPVTVLDFASLYPSSMISGNLSHDTYVTDPRYDHLPGVEYDEVQYDVRDSSGRTLRVETCRFSTSTPGILPMILRDLLIARKHTRAKIKALSGTADAFTLAVLEGQQVAIKITANSVYGQVGARTSALYLKPIAACTTAIGRAMILKAKAFLETRHGANVIYGDTDSVFVIFPNRNALTHEKLVGVAALQASIDEGIRASSAFRVVLPTPHDLEYEKTFFPFFLLSKKRYVGKKFVMSSDSTQSDVCSMGLVTKRRDNAPIVKTIFGGMIDILMDRQDVQEAERFLERNLLDLVRGHVDIDQLVVSKALKGFYKAPDTIAHYVLARRMGERDPGNKPQVNDRIPFVYIVAPLNLLQGERIEDPTFVKVNNIPVDTTHYVTNQIMKPLLQLMSLALERLTGFNRKISRELDDVTRRGGNIASYREGAVRKLLFDPVLASKDVRDLEAKRVRIAWDLRNIKTGQRQLTEYFKFT